MRRKPVSLPPTNPAQLEFTDRLGIPFTSMDSLSTSPLIRECLQLGMPTGNLSEVRRLVEEMLYTSRRLWPGAED
jgi:hypothetical protein